MFGRKFKRFTILKTTSHTSLSFDLFHIVPRQKIQKYLRRIRNLFITNKLSLQLEALSNYSNFTVITILYNNDALTWDYKDNNKYQVTMS